MIPLLRKAGRHVIVVQNQTALEGDVAAVKKMLREMVGGSAVLAVHPYGADHYPSSEGRNSRWLTRD